MARPYPPEFRKEAVELYLSTDRPRSHVAESLGISSESLRRWTEQYQVDRGHRDGLTSDERAELVRLRRQLRQARQERDILKKATAFFARESDTTTR